jgi:hypothetical protein
VTPRFIAAVDRPTGDPDRSLLLEQGFFAERGEADAYAQEAANRQGRSAAVWAWDAEREVILEPPLVRYWPRWREEAE